MKFVRLELERFTAFEKVTFELTSGVNVIIGENGTGKSHEACRWDALSVAFSACRIEPMGASVMP